ncbi:MAG: adenylyltransferase/cytidyltransferase family protein [Chlamydiia bacterium]|nr:adenylyltransferase/cytidyltransferase family protein [Chlamydiia bacterium]
MKAPWKEAKLILPEDLEQKVKTLRQEGKTVATLNGSFDLMHAGHLHMIHEASEQADCLILALNTDDSIKRYKSPKRPLVTLEHRLQMAAALEFVDFVTYFDETDPREFLKKVRPDVHVNGSEYGEDCIEAEVVKSYGGKIHIVKLVPGLSTTNLIEKIKSCV